MSRLLDEEASACDPKSLVHDRHYQNPNEEATYQSQEGKKDIPDHRKEKRQTTSQIISRRQGTSAMTLLNFTHGFYVTEDRRYLFMLFVLFLHGLIMKAGFLDLSGGGERTGITSVSNTIATPTPLINTSAIPIAVSNISAGSPVNAGIQSGIPNAIYMGSIPYINVDNLMSSSQNASANKNGGRKVGNEPVNEFHSSYAAKLSPMSSTKANLRKLEANVPQDADYDVWLPLISVHEYPNDAKLMYELHMFGIIGEEKLCKNSIENDACNDFSDNLLMAVPNLKGTGYTKETIRVEYEWEPPRYSTCLIFGHSLNDCPKAPKRVVNIMDKGKGGSSGADDEGFVEVKKKKSSGNNGGNKNFKSVSVKQKPQYHPKAKQFTEGANQKTNPFVGKKNVSTSSNGTGESIKIQDVKTKLFWEFDEYTQAPKPYKTYAQSSRQTTSTRSHATTRNKGKEIVKPPSPPFESAFEDESNEEQA
ncbi:hypothetical protein Tco_0474668 [Tanacetum coccineum]